jgi:hypothetical protein
MSSSLNALLLRLKKNIIGIPCSNEVAYHEKKIKSSNRPTLFANNSVGDALVNLVGNLCAQKSAVLI